ncbi:MAG TPA: diacylglycerol kinase family protein [Roseiflexaceae bacterium]|nr:diacylglycerol kinase family protein [Roseiflexaceae bacterium]
MNTQEDTSEATAKQQLGQLFVVLNPMAGSCTAADVRQALERHFSADLWNCEIYETTGAEELSSVVRAALAEKRDLVIAVGGDGTVSDVAEALAHTDVPLGIIPAGTANVLARELGIPLALESACALLVGTHAIDRIDAMQVGDKVFILHIGIGIDSLMIRDTERAAKRRYGRAAYLWTAARWLLGYQPRRFTVVVDGQRYRPRAAQVLVANGGVMGMPPFRWGPHIQLDDGKIDVCIISARSFFDYVRVAWHMLSGRQHLNSNMRYLSATRSIIVSADRHLPVQGDGEIISETPVQVRVVPGAVRVVVPAIQKNREPVAAQ